MGFRTLAMLNNDLAFEWEHDPELGRKIAMAMNHPNDYTLSQIGNYGRVVECEHSDTQTIAIIEGTQWFTGLGYGFHSKDRDPESHVRLVRAAAAELGYTLTKIQAFHTESK